MRTAEYENWKEVQRSTPRFIKSLLEIVDNTLNGY
jgi:hypothetical protein